MPSRLSLLLSLCVAASACGTSQPPRGTSAGGASVASSPADSAPAPSASARTDSASSDRRPVVVFLGTSLTAGLGLAREEDTYVSRLGELADSAGLPIRTVNAGVSGDTSADGLSRLAWILKHPLDVLVIELGANDGLRGQDPNALARNLRAVIDRTRAAYPHVRIVLLGMEAPPNMGERYTRRFHDVFPEVAREEHTAFVPFLLAGVAGIPRLNQADRIHPTAAGEVIMAHNVWPVLERVLRSLPAQQGRGS